MTDQITDKNHSKLYYLHNAVDFPSFVKEAELITEEESKELPTAAFADKTNRRYPIDSPSNTWMSNLFFTKYAEDVYNDYEYSEVQTHIENAARLWDIDLDYKFNEAFLKEAAEQTDPVIKYTHNNETVAEVHICAPEDLEKVAADILQNHRKYTYDIRRNVAQQILKTAADMNLDFEHDCRDALEKTAGYGITTSDRALNTLNIRKALLKDNTDVTERIDSAIEMVKTASDRGFVPHNLLQKIAGFVDAIDRLTDLHHPSLNAAPELALFSVTLQDRQELEKHAVVLPNKRIVSRGQLESNKEAVDKYLKDVCDKDNVNNITPHQADYLVELVS